MNYYLDTEFIEGTQKSWVSSKPTIDLISVGIVCEDGREYYAISKDFNLKEAWNRFDIKHMSPLGSIGDSNNDMKVYWLRDNILKPIFYEMYGKDINFHNIDNYFTYKEFKKLLSKHGKNNKQIAEEIKDFVSHKDTNLLINHLNFLSKTEWTYNNRMNIIQKRYPQVLPKFYGYFCDYDWVVFCWLFGQMIDLPNDFPMYCKDLKQQLDEKVVSIAYGYDLELGLKSIKMSNNYPKQVNEHNALEDAKWIKQLHEFLNTL